ncbi:MAG: 3-isopropylmalate dehydratase small subunit [Pseudomonadota bacterium]
MEPFVRVTGLVAPLDRANVDTDAIIPKQYLKSVHRTGFGPNLFDNWRYLDPGEPDQDHSKRRLNPDFVLNQSRYRDAQILLARKNFGCGSSREHAVWALVEYGFRAVIASSFADIFFNNCYKNGLLPLRLKEQVIDRLFEAATGQKDYHLTIDLQVQELSTPGGDIFRFDIDPFRKHCLIQGLDEIDLTLEHAEEIHAFESRWKDRAPWLFTSM